MSLKLLSLAAAAVLLFGACSGGGESSRASSTVASPTTAVEPAAESSSTTAATPPATGVSSSTSTAGLSVEDSVVAVYEMFSSFETDEVADGYGSQLPKINLTTGAFRARMLDNLQIRQDRGSFLVSPGPDHHLVAVTVSGESAVIEECTAGRGEEFNSAGELLGGDSGEFRARQKHLVRVDGVWLISESFGGGVGCDPPSG